MSRMVGQHADRNTNFLVSDNREQQDELVREWYRSRSSLNFRIEAQRNVEENRCTPGTGEWLLVNDTFIRWREQEALNKTLVCHGLPGAGKSTLASVVFKHLQEEKLSGGAAVCCIFCHHQQKPEMLVRDVLLSFLSQLISQTRSVPPKARLLQEQHHRDSTTLTNREVEQLIEEVVSYAFTAVYLVLDALDECDNSNPELAKDHLLKFLKRLGSCGRLNVLATSRHMDDARTMAAKEIRIEATREDITMYLKSRQVRLDTTIRSDEAVCDQIFKHILIVSDGMYVPQKGVIDSIS